MGPWQELLLAGLTEALPPRPELAACGEGSLCGRAVHPGGHAVSDVFAATPRSRRS